MPSTVTSSARTAWAGDLASGSGRTAFETSGLGTYDVSWKARTEPGAGTTSPEELIAAAHASCFSMALSNELAKNETPPGELDTKADVSFVAGQGITGIHLTVNATIEGISDDDFQRIAAAAKDGCPVSQALGGTEITLTASLS